MLSRKTLGVAGAAILGSAALLATNTASAVINLDTGAGVKVAKETLLDNDTTTMTGTTTKFYDLAESGTGGEYDLVLKQGIALGGGATLYLRIELMNMVFNDAVVTGDADSSNTAVDPIPLASGGGVGTNSVVFTLPGDATSAVADVLTIDLPSISVLPNAAGSVKATLHRDSLDASLGTNAIRTVMAEGVVQVVDGLEEKGTSSGSMSDVASGFSMFATDDGTDTAAQIGYLRIKAADNAMHQTGAEVLGPGSFLGEDTAVTPAIPSITVTFKGDFSNHTFTVRSDSDSCVSTSGTLLAGNDAPVLNKDKDELEVKLANAATVGTSGAPKNVMLALCMEVNEKNTMPIPNTDYMATVKYTKLANAMFPRADQTVTVGSIGRTGTTVYIPFLTVNERHHQRLVIINRGPAANYSLRFLTEEGRMATAGADASGMLEADMVTVLSLRNDDVVTIVGGTRTSAELTVVANSADIGVSTVIHSPTTGNTDTVVIQK